MREYGVALVTGAGAGIGRATALALAERGARVVVTDISEVGIAETVRLITDLGGKAMGQRMDVTDAASVDSAFGAAERWDKAVDILVNNAGILTVAPILTFGIEDWHRLMAINVTGSFLCGQRAAGPMVEQRYGRIVNITSISGMRAGVGRVAYGTSKAAVVGMTRQFAMELGPFGVTCNAVGPGAIVSDMTRTNYTEETVARLLPMIPAGQLGAVEDIANAICFFANPASSYVNGDVMMVDGGYTIAGMTHTGSVSLASRPAE